MTVWKKKKEFNFFVDSMWQWYTFYKLYIQSIFNHIYLITFMWNHAWWEKHNYEHRPVFIVSCTMKLLAHKLNTHSSQQPRAQRRHRTFKCLLCKRCSRFTLSWITLLWELNSALQFWHSESNRTAPNVIGNFQSSDATGLYDGPFRLLR